ncbi:hypothetical protein CAOG_05269 [Capsaspora owczarzaki ATCC 30864]|uniref:Uncharacterized protein n=1 Tax=Capsaspora owczarzaki (strain ATCC 30864) TaxID=595528 RepID=A0A0D2WRR5_CAPO3|nr:hypothetical protein CAOG_05269 [Capsaspora owczarzaki ATCC 30864]KJE94655.1 hypothetical protein CAOG_005269 [Capsaspora owczarzaki ATCC 30864]|eukprot:XP_004346954.2 hypothetical protein CAOG_05269 [Capsaspora owczarzaki ATCC 30864]
MNGRVCIVTGANAGIGFSTALQLAELGAHVIMACRSQSKAEQAATQIRAQITKKSPARKLEDIKLDVMVVDLLSFASVKRFAAEFRARKLPLHVLINNAGIMMGSADGWVTPDGNNSVLQVNTLSHFLLTLSLLDIMQATPGEARIINLASLAHRFGWIDFANINGKGCTGCLCYSQSKLANIMLTMELARRLEAQPENRVTVHAVDPDSIYSSFYDNLPTPMWACFRPFLWLMKPIEIGAQTSVFVASSVNVYGLTGVHWFRCAQTRASSACYDRQQCKDLWDLSLSLVHWNENRPAGVSLKLHL